MSVFERYLTLWVFVAGVALGQFPPGVVQVLAFAPLVAFPLGISAITVRVVNRSKSWCEKAGTAPR